MTRVLVIGIGGITFDRRAISRSFRAPRALSATSFANFRANIDFYTLNIHGRARGRRARICPRIAVPFARRVEKVEKKELGRDVEFRALQRSPQCFTNDCAKIDENSRAGRM